MGFTIRGEGGLKGLMYGDEAQGLLGKDAFGEQLHCSLRFRAFRFPRHPACGTVGVCFFFSCGKNDSVELGLLSVRIGTGSTGLCAWNLSTYQKSRACP